MSFHPSAAEVERVSIPSKAVTVRDVSWHTKVLCCGVPGPVRPKKMRVWLNHLNTRNPC